jgi:hypothetical protein
MTPTPVPVLIVADRGDLSPALTGIVRRRVAAGKAA